MNKNILWSKFFHVEKQECLGILKGIIRKVQLIKYDIPAEDNNDDGVGDQGDTGQDGHDDTQKGGHEVEGTVELGGVHHVTGAHVRMEAEGSEIGNMFVVYK